MGLCGQSAKLCSLVRHITIITVILFFTCASASMRISVSAPINPLKEGGILSIRCQIWGVPADGYQVTIFRTRTNGQPEMISVDGLVTLDSDNTFLAERQMNDGSTVYLLSVVHPSKQEAGEYVCKLRDIVGILTDLPSDSIHLEFSYFPPKSDPVCVSDSQSIVYVGSTVTVTCSSEIGSPTVSIKWKRGEIDMKASQYIKDGRVYSQLTLQVSKQHSEAVFVCKVSSVSFPGLVQTCHYRPIVRNVGGEDDSFELTERTDMLDHNLGINDEPNRSNININIQTEASKCQRECLEWSSSQIYWAISTVTAGTLALLFLILVLILYSRYQKANRSWMYQNTRFKQVQRERVYAELQTKQRESVVYMSISRDKMIRKNAHELEG